MNPISNLENQLNCNQSTMAINNQYDEIVDGAGNVQKDAVCRVHIIKSYRHVEVHR